MEHIPVRVRTLRPGYPVTFEVFIKVGSKHIHYIKNGDPIDGPRLEGLKKKGIKKLWIPVQEEATYLSYLEDGLNQLSTGDAPMEEKAEFAKDTMQTEAENAERNLDSEQGYKQTQNRIDKIADFMKSGKDALRGVMEAAGCAEDVFQHSANVSSLCLGLCAKVDVKDEGEKSDLGIAALVHDTGKAKLGFEAVVDRDKLSPEELKKYMTHPSVGVDLLAGKQHITPRVLRMVVQHEELANGLGFPEKKNLLKLPITTQILALANEFDRMSMIRNKPALEVMNEFFEEKSEMFAIEHLSALEELLNGR